MQSSVKRNDAALKSALESMMFMWGEPLDVKTAAEVVGREPKDVETAFEELMEEYDSEARGIRIRRIERGYQMTTFEENGDYIRRLCAPIRKRRLSQSALEVLAIIAYKQPVTKGEIEAVRGIKCDTVVAGLIKKDLVKERGRSDSIGRPVLYGTTDKFLQYMNMESLKDLPRLEEFVEDRTVDGNVQVGFDISDMKMGDGED